MKLVGPGMRQEDRVQDELLAQLRPMPPSATLRERVLASVTARPAPPRSVVVRQTIALTVGSWLIALVVFVYAGGPRVLGRTTSLVLGTSVGIALAAAA